MPEKLTKKKYTSNPELATVLQGWQGTPLDEQGRFVNEEFPFLPKLTDVLRWKFSRNPQKEEKKLDTFILPRREDSSFLKQDKDCLVWLGHASFFLRMGGTQFLIDPVFYNVPFVHRYSEHAFGPQPFTEIEYLLISHDHQDHCQQRSVREIAQLNPKLEVLAGLNMDDLLKPWIGNASGQYAGWFQQYKTNEQLRITFLPTRHWSKRGLSDDNCRLWGAFVFEAGGKTVYFGGDSGYGSHYKTAGKLFPNIDVAMIGCGAFKPEWFMHSNHSGPEDALKSFHDLGARNFVPMHYGTFDLSDEPVGEPWRRLKALEEKGEIKGKLCDLALGEVMYF